MGLAVRSARSVARSAEYSAGDPSNLMPSRPLELFASSSERWRELPGGAIEFTTRRLRSAD
jgi:hypothetical protein